MSDLISRQAAIDALYHVDEYNGRSVEAIRKLPPAQPERTPMQELLDVTADRDYWKAQCHSYEMTINRLTESAQPERIKGRWIPMERKSLFRCSECDAVIYSETEHDRNEFHAFCGRCGADMREVTT